MSAEDDLLRDDEWGATPESAAAAATEAALKDVHTCLPGIVVSFDRNALTARVTPAVQRMFVEKGPVTLPDCVDVPVVFNGGGGVVHTFDLQQGDEVLLHFSERAIDGWWQNGGVQPNPFHRFHDLSDAFASPGPFSQPRAATLVGGVSAGGSELRTLDGTVLVRIDPSGVTLGSKAGAVPTIALTTDVLTWFGKVALAGNGGGAPPGPIPLDFATTLVKVK